MTSIRDWDRATSVYGRGAYGMHYADQLVELVESWNCSLGCQKAGDESVVSEFGPGGTCDLLASLFVGQPVPEFDPRPAGIHCEARIPLDAPVVLDGQEELLP